MGELGGLLCDYLSEIVPHRMGARAAGAQLAAIKAKFEHSGRPDPTAREINLAVRNTLRRRAYVPGGRDEVPALHAEDAGHARGDGNDADAPRCSGRGPCRVLRGAAR